MLKTRTAERSTQPAIAWKLIAYAVAPVMAPLTKNMTKSSRSSHSPLVRRSRIPAARTTKMAAGMTCITVSTAMRREGRVERRHHWRSVVRGTDQLVQSSDNDCDRDNHTKPEPRKKP